MRRRNLLLIACVAMVWSGAAAAQAAPQGRAQTTHGAQNQSAAPANTVGSSSMPGAQAPVRQPSTSPPPSAPSVPANTSPPPSTPTPTPSPANTSPPPSSPTPAPANTSPPPSTSSSMPQQTVVPNQPNTASSARDTASANRARVATQTDTVPPASRGVGTSGNRPDCSQMRGIEKSECERRDTSRDDLPAGVTTTQQPQSPTPPPQPQR
jgi:hypothetical protein